MSSRTAQARKAVLEAWKQEKELVLKATGTRDWTPTQQLAIITIGHAYDGSGKIFEGHHMKSAEKYPEYQGDSKNIQFLTRTEHKDAHGGNFRIPTNGFYNYKTKTTIDFGNNIYKSCEIIKLSKPISSLLKDYNVNLRNIEPKILEEIKKLERDNNPSKSLLHQNKANTPHVYKRSEKQQRDAFLYSR